ncbi:peptide methionine sulfoxide reductase MsrA [Ochromonadaceae sp. CCMP2298]|nr:peptide methionine sulfoxide reductase MsrA [Ochromonadaceae sp. CCMP2298]
MMTLATVLFALTLLHSSAAVAITKRACFGAGCFWGTEKFFKVDFGAKMFKGSGKVTKGAVGYMGPPGSKENPTYREVCSGKTGHVEVYDFEFDGDDSTFEDLCKHFFMWHDPTSMNRQGNDRGTQYASAIFCYDQAQMDIANKVKLEVQALLGGPKGRALSYQEGKVTTEVAPATKFWAAESEHQEYLARNPGGYCNHGYRFTEWPTK